MFATSDCQPAFQGKVDSNGTIVEYLKQDKNLTMVSQWVDDKLTDVTVITPVNEAFQGPYVPFLQMASQSKSFLKGLALYHIVPGQVEEAEFKGWTNLPCRAFRQGTLPTLFPGLSLRYDAGQKTIQGAQIIKVVKAKDGVVIVVDRILLPWTGYGDNGDKQ